MKPATRLACIIVSVIAALHLLRLFTGVSVVIGGAVVPRWVSLLPVLLFAGVAIGLWREHAPGASVA